MKTIWSILLALLLAAACVTACAEGAGTKPAMPTVGSVLPLETSVEVNGLLELTVHPAAVTESLGAYGEDSGDRYQFVCIDLDVCNISFDAVDLSTLLSAELTYADRYAFTLHESAAAADPAHQLLGRWEGKYRHNRNARLCVLEVTEVGTNGSFSGVWHFAPHGSTGEPSGSYFISGTFNSGNGSLEFSGREWIERPNSSWGFHGSHKLTLLEGRWLFGEVDGAGTYLEKVESPETVTSLNMLEETSWTLVFRVPDRVAQDLENCRVVLSVGENTYELTLVAEAEELEEEPAA